MSATLDAQQLVDEAKRKKRQHAQARAALLGIELRITDDDHGRALFVASMHSLTRHFTELGDVESWLDHCGAPA